MKEKSISEVNKEKPLDEKILYLTNSKNGKKEIATLSKIKFREENIPVLITSYTLINEENIKEFKGKVTISKNGQNIELNLVKILLNKKENNISIIQIENNSLNENDFFEFDDTMNKTDYEQYIGKQTYILQNAKEGEISKLCPTIKDIIKTIITFEEKYERANSNFSPIFIKSKNNYKLFGLLDIKYKYFKGICFKKIIKDIIKDFDKKNEIDLLINVDEKDIGKNIYFLGNDDKNISNNYENLNKVNNSTKCI